MGVTSPPFPHVVDRLDSIARSIEETIRASVTPVRELAEHFHRHRGSMVRPGLLLACADLFGSRNAQRAFPLAEMVELIHYASVLHDQGIAMSGALEALDATPEGWGRREAILLGDLLLARAMTLLAEHGGPREVELVSRITGDLAEGQLLAVQLERATDLPDPVRESEQRRVIELRTARFLGHAATLAVPEEEAAPTAPVVLREYAEAMGFAYHLWKDLRDGSASSRRRIDARGYTDRARAALAPVVGVLPLDPLVTWADRIAAELEELGETAA